MMTLKKLVMWLSGLMGKIQICYMAMAGRIIMAAIFWKSAMTKIAFNEAGLGDFSFAQIWNVVTLDWTVASGTYTLFEYEYDLPLLPPELAAHMALAAEILLPMALILGLFTRYAALAMLAMTAVIQIFVYPNLWTVHGLWAIALLVIMAKGGGKLSLDRLICKKYL